MAASPRVGAPLKALGTVMAFAVASAHGGVLSVSVLDSRNQAVPDAAVTVTPVGGPPARGPLAPAAVMDQVGKAFVPGVLVVQTGTAVIFPNSDTVAHQVYSFSPAKRFELGLYRGHPYEPVVFDRPGIVVLGCNIHDNMVGYIFVTDAPYFGKSDRQGAWHSEALPAAEYEVAVWSPRLPGTTDATRTRVNLADAPLAIALHLPEPLRAAVTQERAPRGRY
ncbi:MAG TPA: methylamine utilization protein [Steroidobacteraceae bacterium]|nr:methylamine utilization protein [Steroidobacteraceae bacterium]